MPNRNEHEHPRICVDRVIPLDLRVRAAEKAVEENDSNHPRHLLGTAMMSMGIAAYPYKMALVTGKRWQPGRRLRCGFLGGSGFQRDRVVSIAQEWSQYANIAFDFSGASDPEIRIDFQEGQGSWSAVGTDCLETGYFRPNEPTMNFGWLTEQTDLAEYRRVILHEFGHALAAIHEHSNPVGNTLRWNREAVYRYFSGAPNFWSREEIDRNVLEKYSLDQLNASSFDRKSIMLYAFPPELLLDHVGTPSNGELSPMDKEFIAKWYPGAGHDARNFQSGQAKAIVSAGHMATLATPSAAANTVLPEITVFEDKDFQGDSWRTTFAYSYVGDDWNDRISSFIIHSGSFQFFEHRDFGYSTWSPVTLGPGHYAWVGDRNIFNDSISSWHAFYG